MEDEVYEAEGGHHWTRKELQQRWEKQAVLDAIINWANPPESKAFVSKATKAVDKVFAEPGKYKFQKKENVESKKTTSL